MQLIMIVSVEDAARAIQNIKYIERNLPVDEIVVIGNKKVGEMVRASGKKISFLEEDCLYQGMNFRNIEKIIEKRSGTQGRTGWYFQQFLKMAYAMVCEEEYYLVWDGDTIPVRRIALFHTNGKPYMALKQEYNPAYFDTLKTLLGLDKVRKESFISEHMLIRVSYMKELIAQIEQNPSCAGEAFYEKILYAVEKDMLRGSGFSEFETYGTYVTVKHPEAYEYIPYESCRHTVSMIGNDPTEEQISWMAEKYEAVSFEKWDSPVRILTKMTQKAWFRRLLGIRRYDRICSFRCEAKFWYQRTRRKLGRFVKNRILRVGRRRKKEG